MDGYNAEYEEYLRKKKKREFKIGCIVVCAVFLIFLVLMAVKMRSIIYPVDETTFTAERIEFLEAELKMDLSGVTPERYYVIGIAQDAKDNFVFYVDDYAEFMENCFFGEIISCGEFYRDSIMYRCETDPDDNINMYVTFEKDKGRYRGEVVRSTFVG